MRPFSHEPCVIYLIRHAQSESNAHGNIIGGVDAKLTAYGRAQADALNQWLTRSPLRPKPDHVSCSNMPRAIETAQRLASGLGVDPSHIVQNPLLREIERGDWEKLPREQTLTEHVKEEMLFLDMDHRPPNGESMHDTAQRGRYALLEVAQMIRETEARTFVWVTHGIFIKALLQRLLGINPSQAWLIRIDNTSITKLTYTLNGWGLEYLNVTPHLPHEFHL